MKKTLCKHAGAIVALAALLGLAPGALANPSQMGEGPRTAAGMAPGHIGSDRFDQMDANKDGKVVLEEFRATFPNMSEQAFGVIDVNGDKTIERAEWFDFMEGHAKGKPPSRAPILNNIPGDALIPPPDSNDLPLMRPPGM